MSNEILLINKILGRKTKAKKAKKSIDKKDFVKAMTKELEGRTTPIRGCKMAPGVAANAGKDNSLFKPCGQFHPGALKSILEVPGILMLKPNSKFNKVIRKYEEVTITDTTAVFWILEENWDGTLPTV